jgi:hypothetical protein
MIGRLGLCLCGFALLAACGGGDAAKKTDLTLLEQQMRAKMVEDQNSLRAEMNRLREEQGRVELVAKKMEIQASEVDKIVKAFSNESGNLISRVDLANNNAVKSLEIQEQYLRQLLESIRALIDELKKNK